MEVGAHARVRLLQGLGALENEDALGLVVMGGGGVASGFQNGSQLLRLHRAVTEFAQGIARFGQLQKLHGKQSSFLL